jgi:branched-chain amino acid transport system permease protein
MNRNERARKGIQVVFLTADLVFLGMLPLFAGKFHLKMFSEVFILALWGVTWIFMFRQTGMLSFGHAAPFAVGAYAMALVLNLERIASSPMAMLVALGGAVVASGIAGLVIGYICTRSTEVYFSILTLLFSMVLYSILIQWRGFTGGDDGLTIGNERPLFGISLSDPYAHYYWVLAITGVSIVFLRIVTRSHFGQAILAIRENTERAEFLGLPVRGYRLTSFVIASVFAGVAGALFATLMGSVNPGLAYWVKSAEPMLAALLGGLTYFSGPIWGAAVYLFLVEKAMATLDYWRLILGAVFVLIVLFARGGILGFADTLFKRKFKRSF